MTKIKANPISITSSKHCRQKIYHGRALSMPILVLIILMFFTGLAVEVLADNIAVKEIGGVPVIRCKIHYKQKYIEAHFLLDLGQSMPLIIHEKSVEGLHLYIGFVFQCPFDHGNPLLHCEERRFLRVVEDGDDQPVKYFQGPVDDTEVAVGNRIKGSGVDSRPFAHS